MIFHPGQSEVARDTHRFRVLNAGRRFGKTVLSVWEMFGKAVGRNDRRIVYIAPTYQQARDIAWQELKKVCQPIAVSINESRLEITVKTKQGGESIIWLRGWESIETLRGQRFDFMVLDEVAMMRNFWLNWQEVLRPTLTDTRGEVLFISTPKGFNHFWELYLLEQTDQDYKSFHFTSYDNPNLDPEELAKAKQEIPEDRFAQEYLADFRKTQGLVYKEFDRKIHVFKEKDINKADKMLGIDWGFTNPTAVLTIWRDFDNSYWVTNEYYKRGKTTSEVGEYIRTLGANYVYPDPAEPDRNEELARMGINVRDVSKDVEKGIDSIRSLLKNRKLFVHESCVNLINEFETYSYKDKLPGHNENEEPIKENDHALDALRYALHMQEPLLDRLMNDKIMHNRSIKKTFK